MGFSFRNIGDGFKNFGSGAKRVVSGGGVSNILRGFGEMSDPFHLDPMRSIFRSGPNRDGGVEGFFTDALDPNALKEETEQHRLFKQVGKGPTNAEPYSPEAKSRMKGFRDALSSINQRRAYDTLFTGGLGVSGQPSTSSSSLLGL